MNRKPDFIVVGAAKSGTTFLYNLLLEQPDIFIPDIKECRYFSQLPKDYVGLGAEFFVNQGVTNQDEYFRLFEGKNNYICGDVSNDYLYYHSRSIENIKKQLGNSVKIIIILRNPTERAFSNYMHHIRDGWENITFEKALALEEKRISEKWGWSYHYYNTGLYFDQVKNYIENFKNIKILLYEDLKQPDKINEIFTFLNTEKKDTNLNKKYNVSGKPKFRFIHDFINKKNLFKTLIIYTLKPILSAKLKDKAINLLDKIKNKNLVRLEIEDKTKKYLIESYKSEIIKLSKLIDRDLTGWLK